MPESTPYGDELGAEIQHIRFARGASPGDNVKTIADVSGDDLACIVYERLSRRTESELETEGD
jgi:hypothetical protein